MLADSQGQELYKQMGHLEEEFDVNGSSASGAKMKNVIRNGLGGASDFTEHDFYFYWWDQAM